MTDAEFREHLADVVASGKFPVNEDSIRAWKDFAIRPEKLPPPSFFAELERDRANTERARESFRFTTTDRAGIEAIIGDARRNRERNEIIGRFMREQCRDDDRQRRRFREMMESREL